MQANWIKRAIGGAVVLVAAAGVVYAMWPQPVLVEIATIDRGPLRVTIDEEGVARVRDVFRVSAPVGGHIDRLPVHTGDTVIADKTDVAFIHPSDPSFLDVRSRLELQAGSDAARAGVSLAEAQLKGAVSTEKLLEADLERAIRLSKMGTISLRALEKARADVESSNAAVDQAAASLALRQSELASANARLIEPDQQPAPADGSCCMAVKSPVSGTVIRLINENEQVVAAGTPLLEVGDPSDLELVVHLLSTDAVNVSIGAIATVDGWGGPAFEAKVTRIDPAAYTKVSALGIDEQRVDATLTLTEPREKWRALGHEFRVMAHIATWQAEDVIRVPLGALFRNGSDWAVYRVADGRAKMTTITLGHRNSEHGEVIEGLAAGDTVILHPSDQVAEDGRVAERTTE